MQSQIELRQQITNTIIDALTNGGLLMKDDQGRRQLTAKGREHLSNSVSNAG